MKHYLPDSYIAVLRCTLDNEKIVDVTEEKLKEDLERIEREFSEQGVKKIKVKLPENKFRQKF